MDDEETPVPSPAAGLDPSKLKKDGSPVVHETWVRYKHAKRQQDGQGLILGSAKALFARLVKPRLTLGFFRQHFEGLRSPRDSENFRDDLEVDLEDRPAAPPQRRGRSRSNSRDFRKPWCAARCQERLQNPADEQFNGGVRLTRSHDDSRDSREPETELPRKLQWGGQGWTGSWDHAEHSQDPHWNAAESSSSWTLGDLADAETKLLATEEALSNEQSRLKALQENHDRVQESREEALDIHKTLQEEHVLVQEKLETAEQALSKERDQHKSLQEEHLLLQQKLTAAEEVLSKERRERETLQAERNLFQLRLEMAEEIAEVDLKSSAEAKAKLQARHQSAARNRQLDCPNPPSSPEH